MENEGTMTEKVGTGGRTREPAFICTLCCQHIEAVHPDVYGRIQTE